MRATAEAVEGSKVRLSVEVDEAEIDAALDETVRKLAKEVRVPGFRPGKVPRQVLEARMGGSASLRGEALREALPDFYAQAVAETELDPIAPPDIDITAGEESGAVAFDALVQVRPTVAIPGYAGLRGDRARAHGHRRARSTPRSTGCVRTTASWSRSTARPIDKDNVTIDIHGKTGPGEEVLGADDFLYEVGSGSVVAELDEQLRGRQGG